MRCYMIQGVDAEGFVVATRYAGTNALAREARDSLAERFGLHKRDITIEPADVPTAKADLLAFLNELLAEQDQQEDGAEEEGGA